MSRLPRIATLALPILVAACDTPTTPAASFGVEAQYVFLQGDISIRDIGEGAAVEVSSSGRVVGSTFIDGVEYPASLVGGQFVALDDEPGRGFAVNARGQLTGGSHRYPPLSRDAFLLSKGTLTEFGPGNATDVSDRGEVVGFTRGDGPQLPWVWHKGVQTFLPLLSGHVLGHAWAVSSSGTIVGMSMGPDHSEAVMWSHGRIRGLGTLGGPSATARDLNVHGAVVGRSSVTAEGSEHAFLWTEDGGMVRLPDLDAVSSTAYGINVRGQISGWIDRPIGPGGALVRTAVMWEDGQLVLLPTLMPGESGQAKRINDRGQIAGSSGDRAVVWTLPGSSH